MTDVKGFKIGMLNIRSLWPNLDELRIHFANFDVIGICESWLNPSMPSQMVNLYKHKMFRLDRTSGKRGGGLVIYVAEELFQYSSLIEDFCCMSEDIEQLWIEIKQPNSRIKIVGLVYRPPSGKAEICMESVRGNLNSIQENRNGETTVMGDLNVNYLTQNTSPFKMLKEIERDFGLKQLITEPTRVTQNSSTLIDLMLTDCDQVSTSGVLDINISDHLPIFYVRKKSREKTPKKIVYGRSYKNYNVDVYQRDIVDDTRWELFWSCDPDVNKLWELMYNIIVSHADCHSPVVKMCVNETCPYWYTRELIEEINQKNVLYRRAKSSKLDEDWVAFRKQKNLVKGLIFTSKDSYINEQIDTNVNDSRKIWRNIYQLSGLGKNRTAPGLTEVKDENGLIVKDQVAADYMNNFYISAGQNLTQNFPKVWDETDFKSEIDSIFDFAFITEEEVKKLVDKINLSKSSALGTLSTRLLKDALKVVTLELTHLYNVCLDKGTFPLKWGIGIVTPIPKTSTKSTDAKDWRPITQIALPGKLLERVIHTQLSAYLEQNDILFENQHGFRKDKSTSTAVFSALRDCYENWNTRLYSTCVFIDFSRAFDSIDHNIFICKLKLYGLSEKCITFLSSYIDSRTQCTCINGFKSSEAKLMCGTAQGSILGPLFYILYVNDIFSYVNYNKTLTMYADDTLLIEQGASYESANRACQESLNQVVKWCTLNRLTINIAKTKSMTLCPTSNDDNMVVPINITGKDLQNVNKYEYLGVHIDEKLNMASHIEHVIKKVQAKFATLWNFRKNITENTALKIYKTLIMCHMDYGDYIIDSGTKKNIDKLDNLQTKAIRCIEHQHDTEKRKCMANLYHRFKLEPLKNRRRRNLVKLMYIESKKSVNIEMHRPKMTLRSSNSVKLTHRFTKLTKIQKSPYYRGLELWDKLPSDIQKLESKIEFKNKIKHLSFE